MIQVLIGRMYQSISPHSHVVLDLPASATKGGLGQMRAELIDVTLDRFRRDSVSISKRFLREDFSMAQPIVHIEQARAFIFVFVHVSLLCLEFESG